jgi:hypothetical protein
VAQGVGKDHREQHWGSTSAEPEIAPEIKRIHPFQVSFLGENLGSMGCHCNRTPQRADRW